MSVSSSEHPLLAVLLDAASHRFPAADGGVVFMPPLRPRLEPVVALTGRVPLATALTGRALPGPSARRLRGGVAPSVLVRLAGEAGAVGVVDATLVARGTGRVPGAPPPRSDLDGHPRVRHARDLREDVVVHGDERGLVTFARGLAGRTEMSAEASGTGTRGRAGR